MQTLDCLPRGQKFRNLNSKFQFHVMQAVLPPFHMKRTYYAPKPVFMSWLGANNPKERFRSNSSISFDSSFIFLLLRIWDEVFIFHSSLCYFFILITVFRILKIWTWVKYIKIGLKSGGLGIAEISIFIAPVNILWTQSLNYQVMIFNVIH